MTTDLLRDALHAYPLVSGIGTAATLLLLAAHHLLDRPSAREPHAPPRRVERALWLVTAASVVALAGTALAPLWLGSRMHGGLVLAHVAAGGVAGIALAGVALSGAAANRRWHGRARSFAFHCVLLLGLAALLSALAPMYGWVGAPASEALLDVHRWSGLGLVIAVGAHTALRRPRHADDG